MGDRPARGRCAEAWSRPAGTSADAYEPGSWDEIERAYYRGLLTDEEIGRLMECNKDALEQAARSA